MSDLEREIRQKVSELIKEDVECLKDGMLLHWQKYETLVWEYAKQTASRVTFKPFGEKLFDEASALLIPSLKNFFLPCNGIWRSLSSIFEYEQKKEDPKLLGQIASLYNTSVKEFFKIIESPIKEVEQTYRLSDKVKALSVHPEKKPLQALPNEPIMLSVDQCLKHVVQAFIGQLQQLRYTDMTYERFVKEVYPFMLGEFEKHAHYLHNDFLPLWQLFSQKTLAYYESLFKYSASRVKAIDVIGYDIVVTYTTKSDGTIIEQEQTVTLSKRNSFFGHFSTSLLELSRFLWSSSTEYTRSLFELQKRISDNFLLFREDKELEGVILDVMSVKRKHLLENAIPRYLLDQRIHNYIVYGWNLESHPFPLPLAPGKESQGFIDQYGTTVSGGVSKHCLDYPKTSTSLVKTNFYDPVSKALTESLSFLEKQKRRQHSPWKGNGITQPKSQTFSYNASKDIDLRSMREELLNAIGKL